MSAFEPLTSTIANHPEQWLVAAVIVAMLLTVWVCYLVAKRHMRAKFEEGLTLNTQQYAEEKQLIDERMALKERELSRVEGEREVLRQEIDQHRTLLAERNQALSDIQSEHAALGARFDEARKAFADREALFVQQSAQLKVEFENLANRIFEHQGKASTERLTAVLSPLRDQMQDFRKRVDEVYSTESKDRASLLTEVRNLQQASERINTEAENLTKALKGDKKLQGNWGELVLERVLEESGLRKDHEYFLQPAHRDQKGSLKRPDVLVRLPDGKDIVIDAKVSLNAYEQALNAEDPLVRQEQLQAHVNNVRTHVRRLSQQNYDDLPEVRSLDFVLMFVPIESAFTLAMQADARLFTDAFETRIVLVSPTSLMMALRIIHNVWRVDKQNRNTQEIANRAGRLYDKLRGFLEEMDKLGAQLQTSRKTYDSAYQMLASGRGNLVRQAEQFRELGAKVKKQIARQAVENALEAEPDGLLPLDDPPVGAEPDVAGLEPLEGLSSTVDSEKDAGAN